MKFRTECCPEMSSLLLSPEKPVVMCGSCFTQNIASKMHQSLWDAVDPCGTLYNPLSIYEAIRLMVLDDDRSDNFENSLFHFNGLWNSDKFDSSFSSKIKEDCVEEFRNRKNQFLKSLAQGRQIIITFGTSMVYYRENSAFPVGNCHKQPSSLFYRKRLKIDDIVLLWKEAILELQKKFPGLKIIFTVSPVRHLKDGFEGNSRSKAILLLAAEEICRNNPECSYFPAYEILNDDLRDYRFYSQDLVHPSEAAIDYIWEKFLDTYLDAAGKALIREGESRYKASRHRANLGALGKPLV